MEQSNVSILYPRQDLFFRVIPWSLFENLLRDPILAVRRSSCLAYDCAYRPKLELLATVFKQALSAVKKDIAAAAGGLFDWGLYENRND